MTQEEAAASYAAAEDDGPDEEDPAGTQQPDRLPALEGKNWRRAREVCHRPGKLSARLAWTAAFRRSFASAQSRLNRVSRPCWHSLCHKGTRRRSRGKAADAGGTS